MLLRKKQIVPEARQQTNSLSLSLDFFLFSFVDYNMQMPLSFTSEKLPSSLTFKHFDCQRGGKENVCKISSSQLYSLQMR